MSVVADGSGGSRQRPAAPAASGEWGRGGGPRHPAARRPATVGAPPWSGRAPRATCPCAAAGADSRPACAWRCWAGCCSPRCTCRRARGSRCWSRPATSGPTRSSSATTCASSGWRPSPTWPPSTAPTSTTWSAGPRPPPSPRAPSSPPTRCSRRAPSWSATARSSSAWRSRWRVAREGLESGESVVLGVEPGAGTDGPDLAGRRVAARDGRPRRDTDALDVSVVVPRTFAVEVGRAAADERVSLMVTRGG